MLTGLKTWAVRLVGPRWRAPAALSFSPSRTPNLKKELHADWLPRLGEGSISQGLARTFEPNPPHLGGRFLTQSGIARRLSSGHPSFASFRGPIEELGLRHGRKSLPVGRLYALFRSFAYQRKAYGDLSHPTLVTRAEFRKLLSQEGAKRSEMRITVLEFDASPPAKVGRPLSQILERLSPK